MTIHSAIELCVVETAVSWSRQHVTLVRNRLELLRAEEGDVLHRVAGEKWVLLLFIDATVTDSSLHATGVEDIGDVHGVVPGIKSGSIKHRWVDDAGFDVEEAWFRHYGRGRLFKAR